MLSVLLNTDAATGSETSEMSRVSGLSVALALVLVLLPASAEALKEGECEGRSHASSG